jgi:hypothetical protein
LALLRHAVALITRQVRRRLGLDLVIDPLQVTEEIATLLHVT